MVLTRACRTVLAGCTTAILVGAPDAHAQLQDAVDRIANAWRSAGGWVEVDKHAFSETMRPPSSDCPIYPKGECTTIALIGARVLGFHVRLLGDGEPPRTGTRRARQVPCRISDAARPRRAEFS